MQPQLIGSGVFEHRPDLRGMLPHNNEQPRQLDRKTLLLSGRAQTSDLLELALPRGHDFPILAKPVHPTDLLIAIHSSE
jgi:hypothetical protein